MHGPLNVKKQIISVFREAVTSNDWCHIYYYCTNTKIMVIIIITNNSML